MIPKINKRLKSIKYTFLSTISKYPGRDLNNLYIGEYVARIILLCSWICQISTVRIYIIAMEKNGIISRSRHRFDCGSRRQVLEFPGSCVSIQ